MNEAPVEAATEPPPLGVAAAEGNPHADLGEVLDDGAADPRRAARDQRRSPTQLGAHRRTLTARSAASIPPSTDNAAPVLPEAASESRYATASATSVAVV